MFNRWFVVADSSRARIFSYNGVKAELSELDDLSHPESRLHESELTADLPGRSFDSAGQGRHAMEQPVSAKEQEARSFATQIAAYLDKACNENRLESLIVIAAPEFLGHLRAGFSAATR